MPSGRPRIKDLFTPTELVGGKERSLLAVEYEEEKRLKERAKADGIVLDKMEDKDGGELKSLSIKHKFILALYMTGKYSQVEIAREADVHYVTVHKVLKCKLGQELLTAWKEMMELELDGLMPLAVDAIRSGLKSSDKKEKLLAVDRFMRMAGVGEDTKGVTVNIVNEARVKFITDLKQIAEQENIIEVEFEEVKEVEQETPGP